MKYSNQQLNSIEKVKTVFHDYIKASKTLDLLWSDKVGYLFAFYGLQRPRFRFGAAALRSKTAAL